MPVPVIASAAKQPRARAPKLGAFAPGLLRRSAPRNDGEGASMSYCSRDLVSDAPRHHQLLDLADRLGRIETLRARLGAVHDRVAAVEPEGVLEIIEAFAGHLVAAVGDPAVSLEQYGRP